jgi:hypothetical protein
MPMRWCWPQTRSWAMTRLSYVRLNFQVERHFLLDFVRLGTGSERTPK